MGQEHLTPFEPGQSGNPAGRPVGALNRSTLYKRHLEKKGVHGLVMDDIIIKAISKAVDDGDMVAIKELMDGAFGKITDKVESTGKDGKDLFPSTIAVNVVKPKDAEDLKAEK